MQAQPRQRHSRTQGIETRHARSCPKEPCRCKPTYQASVWSARERKRIRKTFSSLAEAKAWRADAIGAVRRGTMRSPTRVTLGEAANDWFEKAKAGIIRSRSDRPYKPSTLREYESDFNTYIRPEIGYLRLGDVQRRDIQDIADRLVADGWQPTTVRNAVMPVRAIFRKAIEDGDVALNPTAQLRLPAARSRRERVATPAEASSLLAALPDSLRALYATAFYGGLRRGELRGLRWSDIDLAAGVIRVERAWDDKEGEIETKSEKGQRTVPIPSVLREILLEHGLMTKRIGSALVFGRTESEPFTPSHVRRSADEAWERHNIELAEQMRPESERLAPIGLHEARHTYVTLMSEAGTSLEQIGDFVGHSTTYMTDRYRHLLPGTEAEAAARLDRYLAAAGRD